MAKDNTTSSLPRSRRWGYHFWILVVLVMCCAVATRSMNFVPRGLTYDFFSRAIVSGAVLSISKCDGDDTAACEESDNSTGYTAPSSISVPPGDRIGPYTSQKVIIMGLPKTGTTSLAQAFQALGYNVSHNMGDTLSRSESGKCNVIANTLEYGYEALDRKHPNATWVITYSNNATGWVDSWIEHMSRSRVKFTQIRSDHRKLHMNETLFLSGFPSGDHPIRTPNMTRGFMERHRMEYEKHYKDYYSGLFAHFRNRLDTIPVVDVRSGDGYDKLYPVARNGTAAISNGVQFPHANSREHRGGFPKCK